MKYQIRLLALMMSALMLLAICGCSQDASSLDRILRQERIVFGIAPDNLPVSGGTAEQPTGISAAIGNELAARLSVEAEYIVIPEAEAIAALGDGTIDCYLNLTEPDIRTITQLRPVDSLFDWRQVAIVPASSTARKLVSLSGCRLCVVSGSDAAAALDSAELFKASMSAVVPVEDLSAVLSRLSSGDCSAAVVDEMQFFAEAGSLAANFAVINEPLDSRSYIIAFRYNDAELSERIQSIYTDMNTDGTLAAIRTEWLG